MFKTYARNPQIKDDNNQCNHKSCESHRVDTSTPSKSFLLPTLQGKSMTNLIRSDKSLAQTEKSSEAYYLYGYLRL